MSTEFFEGLLILSRRLSPSDKFEIISTYSQFICRHLIRALLEFDRRVQYRMSHAFGVLTRPCHGLHIIVLRAKGLVGDLGLNDLDEVN